MYTPTEPHVHYQQVGMNGQKIPDLQCMSLSIRHIQGVGRMEVEGSGYQVGEQLSVLHFSRIFKVSYLCSNAIAHQATFSKASLW